jgi:hypothetical protein
MITSFASNKVLDWNFGGTSYSGTLPGTYYFGLSTTTINFDGTGATEPSGGSYARVAFVNSKSGSTWGSAGAVTPGVLTNAGAVTFPESSASWGTITYVGMWDASTAGNIWWFDVLSPSRAIASLTTTIFAIGSITVTFNNT